MFTQISVAIIMASLGHNEMILSLYVCYFSSAGEVIHDWTGVSEQNMTNIGTHMVLRTSTE